jgi:GT2 family glycosyltransferase
MNLVLKKFGVVVVLYGKGASDALQNYPAIFERLNALAIPIVFVDHGSHAFGEQHFSRENVLYIRQENKGFSSGVNLGCRSLFKSCEYAIVLNPDLHFSVEELLDIGANLSKPFVVIETQEGGIKRAIRFFNKLTGVISDQASTFSVPYFNGAAFSISKKLFEKTGGFDEKFFLYFEDVDFSLQLNRLSIPLEIIKTNSFVHEVGGSQIEGRAGSSFIQKSGAKSALRLTYKWFPWNLWLYVRYSLKWLLAEFRGSR